MKKICFTSLRHGFPSARIRCDQIAAALGAGSFAYSREKTRAFDCIVFVKFPPPLDEMKLLHAENKLLVLDPLDFFDFKEIGKRAHLLDGLIGASLSHAIHLNTLFPSIPCRYLPHHHANFENHRNPIKDPADCTLGYIGDRRYVRHNEFIGKLGYPAVFNTTYENLDKAYSAVDIGFFYRSIREKTLYNSNIKLLNFMAWGIPSVVVPERSFLELARHGEHCLFAESKQEFRESIERLRTDMSLRGLIAENAFKTAQSFHVRKVAELYRAYFADFFGIKL